MSQAHQVTVIPGDGVGPGGRPVGVPDHRGRRRRHRLGGGRGRRRGVQARRHERRAGETRDSIERTRVALKGPLETPVGFGEKSANVTLRKLFETYANIRPARQPRACPPATTARASTSSSCARTSRTCTRASSTTTPGRRSVPQDHQPAGLREDHPLRLRAGRSRGSAEGHLRHQGQHPEAHRGPVQGVFEELRTEYPEITPST